MANSEIRTTLLHLRDSEIMMIRSSYSIRIFASIIGISQMQRAQCGFHSLTWKRDGLFLQCMYKLYLLCCSIVSKYPSWRKVEASWFKSNKNSIPCLQCTLCRLYTLYCTILCKMYTVHCTLYTVHCIK